MPHRSPIRCTTNNEIKCLDIVWWAGQDSNLQPDRYERPELAAPETIATNDLAAKLAAADAAISNIQELLGGVRTSYEELRQALDDLERDRDEWRGRAERLTERPWWRRLAG